MASSAEQSSAFSFVDMEHEILARWQELDIFHRSVAANRDNPPYIFYDGPPFATGMPHHGHFVASTIKDVVPRYWTMKGRYVLRRFGWDCHGLPIEQEIDKDLGMSAREAVEQFGVAGYNDRCRAIVARYVKEWREIITRLGRWVDFDDDYKTMDAWYMESVWWVVKQLWDRGLVYQGFKVMPVSTALQTVLANFEAGLNYQDVQDPAVTVLFKLEDEDAYLAAWTTTPWTLPSNLAVCAGPSLSYVKVRDEDENLVFYMAEARLAEYQSRHPNLKVLERVDAESLRGRRYQPLFDYFAHERERGAFQVVLDDYVTSDEGTGLVHQAPAFGEDDRRAVHNAGIESFVCPVTMSGAFTDEVRDFAGQYVKDADKAITRHLRDAGALYEQAVIEHSYPYCWRSDTPLIYRAVPSWFVRVTEFKYNLIAANDQVLWVPDHIKTGRFGNWLEGAIDWAISRNRVWGTPLPIWINDVTGNTHCIGSLDELEALTGTRPDDLHREHVDDLTFTKEGEEGTYRRIEEVLDCWFESGSMPYAQLHYPFENQEVFERGFPAEFIAEGLDQTRGWFYTLMVLGAALFDKPAFKNVIVNGMVLAEDGKKMSKSLRNYTAPEVLMETYGADALRLYLMNSGLVRAEEQRFVDSGVRDMVRRALLPWYNAFSFLTTYAEIDGWTPEGDVADGTRENILDQWILSRLQTLKHDIAAEMEGYRLYNVVPKLFSFIEDLTNWYIRLNRSRFWGEGMTADKASAYETLHAAVFEVSVAMAPFAPYLSEHIYLALTRLSGHGETGYGKTGSDEPEPASVHMLRYPESNNVLVKRELEDAVERMHQVILLGRHKREEVRVHLRTPLKHITIIHRDEAVLAELRALEPYIKAELNVKSVRYDSDEAAYMRLVAKPNFPVLGKRLGKRMKAFQAKIAELELADLQRLQSDGHIDIGGETFTTDEIDILQQAAEGTNTVSNQTIAVDLDCTLDDELIAEGHARELVNRINRSRKELGFAVSDRIHVTVAPGALDAVIDAHHDYIAGEVLARSLKVDEVNGNPQSAEVAGNEIVYALDVAADG